MGALVMQCKLVRWYRRGLVVQHALVKGSIVWQKD